MTTPSDRGQEVPPDGTDGERCGTGDEWWKSVVVYQVYLRSFADSDGDGVGDLRGLVSRLDYLAWLGIGAIWLSPVFPSPQADHGYDVSDYCAIDPVFGSLDDFDELVRQCHARGIRVLLDVVLNHTSDEHPWFVESRSGRGSAKRDWYWWRPARAGGQPGGPGDEPNNWRSYFGGSAWQYDEASGEYYLHLFDRKQPDLNWENPEVREAVQDTLRFWVDRDVDGFRLDVINLISKYPHLPDGPDLSREPDDGPVPPRQPWVMGPRLHEFLKELHERVIAPAGRALATVGEAPDVTVAEARLLTDPARRELSMVFQFEHVEPQQGTGKWETVDDLVELKRVLSTWQTGLADVGWNSLYLGNHDRPRSVSRFGDDRGWRVESAKLLATVLHLHRGTPFVYQGDEIGMTNAPLTSVDDLVDVESIRYYHSAVAQGVHPERVMAPIRRLARDNARTPMQWSPDRFAGFSSGPPWYAVNPNHVEINVCDATADPGSVLHYYRDLVALRRSHRVVVDGDFTLYLAEHEYIYAFSRSGSDGELLVLANFSEDPVAVPASGFPRWPDAEPLIGNYDLPWTPLSHLTTLEPWECRVYFQRHDQ